MLQEQEKNLRAYLNNIPYEQKDIVRDHILRLLRENESIPCVRTGVAKNKDDSYYCYIEATGFTLIGKELHQIRILFPHNYPTAPPQFHLLYKEDQHKIENEAALLANKVINFEKTPANEVFLNLKFPFLETHWRTERRNVSDAYRQIYRCLNNPPLLTERVNERIQPLRGTMGTLADNFVLQMQIHASQIQDSTQKGQNGRREVDYHLSRADFFKRNIPKLINNMKTFEKSVATKVEKLQELSVPLTFEGNCDPILDLNEVEKQRIKVVATREGLKEGQRRFVSTLEKELQANTCRFADYRNLVRTLSQKMFEAQTNYLKMSD